MRLEQGTAALEKALIQLVVPGKETVTLREPGEYTIFHEYLSTVAGKAYATGAGLDGLIVAVTYPASGAEMSLSSPSMTQRYAIAGRAGVSVLKFTISDPGPYEIRFLGQRAGGAAAGPAARGRAVTVARPRCSRFRALRVGGAVRQEKARRGNQVTSNGAFVANQYWSKAKP